MSIQGPDETPEQLNSRLRRALLSMSPVKSKYAISKPNNEFDTFTNAWEMGMFQTPELNIRLDTCHDMSTAKIKETPEERNARLERARKYLLRIRPQLYDQLKPMKNETPEERKARLERAQKRISEVKLNKRPQQNAQPKSVRKEVSEVKIKKQRKSNDRLGHSQTAQTKVEISPEANRSTSDNPEFENTNQEHKPKDRIGRNTSDIINLGEDCDKKDNIHVKIENAYDDEFHIDLEDPFKKIQTKLNEDSERNSEKRKKKKKLKPNPENNAWGIINNESDDSLLCQVYEEIKALHNFKIRLLPDVNIEPNAEVDIENAVTVKQECDV